MLPIPFVIFAMAVEAAVVVVVFAALVVAGESDERIEERKIGQIG